MKLFKFLDFCYGKQNFLFDDKLLQFKALVLNAYAVIVWHQIEFLLIEKYYLNVLLFENLI